MNTARTQKLSGVFNGIGSQVYLCVGAIPRKVTLTNVTISTNPNRFVWEDSMQGEVTACGGILVAGNGTVTKAIVAAGIAPYVGGDLMTSANQTSTAYKEGVYLGWDETDYRQDYQYGPVATGIPINKWTFDGTLSGHFNSDGVAAGCRIGLGSIIRILETSSGLVKEAGITALTSTPNFTTASYVTLSRAIGSGIVTFIGGMYSLAPIAIGRIAPAGIVVNDTTVNVNDNLVCFDMDVDG